MATIYTTIKGSFTKKNGTKAIMLIVYVKRTKVRLSTDISVKPEDWDDERSTIKRSDKEENIKNLIIENCRKRVAEVLVKYHLKDIELTPNALIDEYKIKSSYISFFEFTDKQIQIRKRDVEPQTISYQETHLNKLKEFKPNLKFSDINDDFLKSYERHLRIEHKNKINTIWSNLKTIKTYLGIAHRLGIIDHHPFRNYKLKKVESEIVFLAESEIEDLLELYKFGSLSEGLHNVLEYFLFACFTGFRISDVRRLKVDNIINDMIILQPKKTKKTSGKVVYMPINSPIRLILEPILGEKTTGPVFNMFSDQVINRNIKSIAEIAEINKDINFKTARHTFATLYLKYNPGDLFGLQNLLGHTKITQSLVYAHIHPADLNTRMNNFNKLI